MFGLTVLLILLATFLNMKNVRLEAKFDRKNLYTGTVHASINKRPSERDQISLIMGL